MRMAYLPAANRPRTAADATLPGKNRPYNETLEMTALPNCPECSSSFTYNDGILLVCPECGHEWSAGDGPAAAEELPIYKDAVGNVLSDGDSVTVSKDLKVKGSSSVLKAGTKVRNIRLVEGDHNIDCKIDGFGPMKLKSEFVKKAQA